MTQATKTTIDWLRVRVQAEPRDILQAMRPMFGPWGQYLRFGDNARGLFGFKHALPIQIADSTVVGRMDFGGDSQRGWVRVDLPGKGCQWVKDWDAVEEVEALPCAEPRRVDIALTTWNGEITHEMVKQAHQEGGFTTRGRPPNMQEIVNSDKHRGRTIYIGRRDGDKFVRAYEKGYELASRMPVSQEYREGIREIDGHRIEDIYRVELELKAEGTELPWDVIQRRDQYFAGAYPFLGQILPDVEPDILQRRPERQPQTDLRAALENVRIQFGATLFTALHAYHGDIGAVWDRIVGNKHNKALLEAGVLLVDHD